MTVTGNKNPNFLLSSARLRINSSFPRPKPLICGHPADGNNCRLFWNKNYQHIHFVRETWTRKKRKQNKNTILKNQTKLYHYKTQRAWVSTVLICIWQWNDSSSSQNSQYLNWFKLISIICATVNTENNVPVAFSFIIHVHFLRIRLELD